MADALSASVLPVLSRPDGSHVALLDAVFGSQRFTNEIVWQRTYSHNIWRAISACVFVTKLES